jgi:hypothetical protein
MNPVVDYINAIEEGPRKELFLQMRGVIIKNLPNGFEEEMNYGMIGYVVPHSLYPKGYHCSPELPLPFVNLVIRKDIITFYHMGLYADPAMLSWFEKEYIEETGKKPDMGKSCIRFKKTTPITFQLIGSLMRKISPEQWIERYEAAFVKK